MFTSLITAYVNIIHAKFQSQSQQYPIIFRLLNISRENIVTLFRLPLIFTYFSLCHNYKQLLRLFDDGKIFIPLFLIISNNLHYSFKIIAPKDSPLLSILSYIYIYIQYYIKFPFIITLEDNDTIPNSLNVPRLHTIQPFTHRLSKFTTNRNVSIIFHQKLY